VNDNGQLTINIERLRSIRV